MHIPFNQIYSTGKETSYIQDCINRQSIGADGYYTQKCQTFLEERYQFSKCLLTTSCTSALEICALLLDLEANDEVIMPSYTFVSTANAFALHGAKIVFADSETLTPNIDASQIEKLITPRTKAIVVMHYAGIACDMERIMEIAQKHNLIVIEDAAQCIDAYWNNTPLGVVGHFGTFSFDQTKNITAGVGGALVIREERFQKRAEIIRTKGTNRNAFLRGEVNKYGWVDVGSAFAPADLVSAFLYAQLEAMSFIQNRRLQKWHYYQEALQALEKAGKLRLPCLPTYSRHNAHLFYLLCADGEERNRLASYLKNKQIEAHFHYISLHSSPYWVGKYAGEPLINSDYYTNCLLRLPLYVELTKAQQAYIVQAIQEFYQNTL